VVGRFDRDLPWKSAEKRAAHASDLARATEARAVASAAARVLEEEFERRGGWTRYWPVSNAGGHVHSSIGCAT
jgi:hypothetical protein